MNLPGGQGELIPLGKAFLLPIRLPKLLARCRERYPGIHLQLSTSDAAPCLQRLESDEVDVAVVPEPDSPAAELRFVRLAHTSTLRGRIEHASVHHPPRGYHVSLCAKSRTLVRRSAAALWELAPASATLNPWPQG